MATFNQDAVDLANVAVGGVIREDVMDKLWNIDPIERPFHERAQPDSASSNYTEHVQEELDAVDVTNARVDGADAGADSGRTERRVGTYTQISDKVVRRSDRAQAVTSVGGLGSLLKDVMLKQKALRRDCEGIALSPQAAQPGDGDEANAATTGPGKTAGAQTWIQTNYSAGAAGGAAGQMSDNVNKAGYPSVAPTPGTIRALSDATVKTLLQAQYLAGGNPTVIMSRPEVIASYSAFHFGTDAKIATLTSDKAQPGDTGALTAYSSVNVLSTDHGLVLTMIPNRQQQLYNTDTAAALFIMDMRYWLISTLQGYQTKKLAKTGTAENRQITVDWGVVCTAEKAQGCVADIDPTLAAAA